ncbi:hypothetical protein FKM82_018557, partial [Ascaphus truei]
HCHGSSNGISHNSQKYFHSYPEVLVEAGDSHAHGTGGDQGEDSRTHLALQLENVILAENHSTEVKESTGDAQMSEEMLALVDEFENSWPLEAFEGALEVKGRRMDLQGIRVLKKGSQDGQSGSCFGDCDDDDDEAEWITFQVKRLKKPKTDAPSTPDLPGTVAEEDGDGENDDDQAALEISGPKIPAPGPQGTNTIFCLGFSFWGCH